MKTGFKDPIAPKEKKEGKSPWNFKAPDYDKRSSNFVSAGTHHGVGFRQPVGHEDNPKQRVAVMPFGRPATMKDDDRG